MAVPGGAVHWISPAPETMPREAMAPIDRAYWLAHCEGYRVDSHGGRIGLVEDVRIDAGSSLPESFVVLAGMFGRRRIVVHVSQVEAIVPNAQRILLKGNATI